MASKKVSQLSSVDATKPVVIPVGISQRHYKVLEEIAKKRGMTVEHYIKEAVEHHIADVGLWAGVLCTFIVMCSTYGIYNTV